MVPADSRFLGQDPASFVSPGTSDDRVVPPHPARGPPRELMTLLLRAED